jgi:hypothetical protein
VELVVGELVTGSIVVEAFVTEKSVAGASVGVPLVGASVARETIEGETGGRGASCGRIAGWQGRDLGRLSCGKLAGDTLLGFRVFPENFMWCLA